MSTEVNGAHIYVAEVVDFMAGVRERPEGWLYDGPDDFILRHGKEGGSKTLTPEGASTTAKECYTNAGRLALNNPGLIYVEGYATAIVPVSHAWCIDAEGRVIDPTWPDHDEADYFGVAFSTSYLLHETLRTETWGLLWEDGCQPNIPLLTGKAEQWEA